MPSTLITTRAGWIETPETVFDAVQTALTEAIGTPPQARHIRLIELPVTHFATTPDNGPLYTELQITLFSGRTPELKQALYTALKRNFASLGVPEDDVKVILIEAPRENWS